MCEIIGFPVRCVVLLEDYEFVVTLSPPKDDLTVESFQNEFGEVEHNVTVKLHITDDGVYIYKRGDEPPSLTERRRAVKALSSANMHGGD